MDGNCIHININGKNIRCLIDSGASISCCSINLLRSLNINTKQIQQSRIQNAVGVGGEHHSILGLISLPLCIGKLSFIHPFHVFSKLQQTMILGMDFLEKHKVDIHLSSNCIFIPDSENEAVVHSLEMNCGLARSLSRIKIKPMHQAKQKYRCTCLTSKANYVF